MKKTETDDVTSSTPKEIVSIKKDAKKTPTKEKTLNSKTATTKKVAKKTKKS